MARPRKPIAVAQATGQADWNPARFKDRRQAARCEQPLGDPPDGMNLLEIAIWCEMSAIMWWLTADHRTPAEMLCRLTARMREGVLDSEVINGIARYWKLLGVDAATSARIMDPDETEEEGGLY